MEDRDIKQEVISGVIDELKKSNTFVSRDDIKDEIHNQTMDVLKDVKPVRPNEFDATTLSQKKMVEEDVCKWYQRVLGERKAWDGVTTHVGLEMVPELVAGRIVEKLDNTPFRQNVTKFPGGEKGTINVENTLPTALRMGATRAATAETTPATTEVDYTTYGGTAWLLLSNKLVRNAAMPLVQYIENSMVRSVSRLETYEWTLGNGTRSFTGMETGATAHDATAGIDTMAEITLAQILADYFSLDEPYRSSATWVVNSALLAQIWPLNKADYPSIDIVNKTIMGRPYIVLPSTSFATVGDTKAYSYFGDLSYFYLFEDKPISLKVSDVGYTLTTGDQTIIAAQFETDGKVVLPAAINRNLYNTA